MINPSLKGGADLCLLQNHTTEKLQVHGHFVKKNQCSQERIYIQAASDRWSDQGKEDNELIISIDSCIETHTYIS